MAVDITWIGHSTVVVDLDGVRLIADPLIGINNGILRRRGISPNPDAWADTDVVLISHLHHDHAELSSLRLLGDIPIFTASENAAWFQRRGLNGQALEEDSWQAVGTTGDVRIKLAPAIHAARPMPHRPNAANGHLVQGPSATLWLAGDTELFPGLSDLPDAAGGKIDIALVPVGGWGARLSKGHMGPKEAAIACRMVGAKWGIPVHWGTLHVPGTQAWPRGWMDYAGPAFATVLETEYPACKPLVLEPGETVSITTHPA